MRNPTGLRTESARTPFASRAGALHSHIHRHHHSGNPGEARMHRHLGTGPSPASMHARSAGQIGGGQ